MASLEISFYRCLSTMYQESQRQGTLTEGKLLLLLDSTKGLTGGTTKVKRETRVILYRCKSVDDDASGWPMDAGCSVRVYIRFLLHSSHTARRFEVQDLVQPTQQYSTTIRTSYQLDQDDYCKCQLESPL